MKTGLPCPNPACNYLFPHAQVQGASALTCPQCGKTFQFRPGPAKPPTARVVPPAAPPLARPVVEPALTPARPLAEFAPGPIISTAHARRRSQGSGWMGILVGVMALLIVAALVAGGVKLVLDRGSSGGGGPESGAHILNGLTFNKQGKEERAFRLILPRGIWEGSEKLKRGLRAVAALERTEPNAWLAIAVQDYGAQLPRDAELLKGAIARLEGYFGENLELGDQPEPGELAGRPAHVLPFRGSVNNVVWAGECWMLSRHGLGYWLFVGGAPGLEQAQQVLAELQEKGRGLVLVDDRKGWTEQPPEMETFASAGGEVAVKGRKGIWRSFESIKEADANAILYLDGRDVKEAKDNLKSATVLVLSLPARGSDLAAALRAGRAYLEESKKQEGKGYQIVPAGGKDKADEGQPRKLGNTTGQVAELRLVRAEQPLRYILLAVVRSGDRIYVFDCEAHWQHYQAWRGDFLELLRTLRLK